MFLTRVLRQQADSNQEGTLAHRFRSKRARRFLETMIHPLSRNGALPTSEPITLLDVGGTVDFWRMHRGLFAQHFDRLDITVINNADYALKDSDMSNVRAVHGDATDLRFPDGAFDVVFSNSVIEHVGDREQQRSMAREVYRVGRSHWVQTPCKYTPLPEPHFHAPLCNNVFPRSVRVKALLRTSLAHNDGRVKDLESAAEFIDEVRLFTRRELATIFDHPKEEIATEYFLGMPKSYTAILAPDVAVSGSTTSAAR